MQAEEVLLWAHEEFGDRMCLTCSWQRQSSALVHMIFGELGLEPFDAWITGIRREQALTRADAQRVEWSSRYAVWKIQPIVDWDSKRVQAYIHVNEVPYNPLHDAGYPSIGCIPCTRPVRVGEDERAGRWTGADKIECGIHTK